MTDELVDLGPIDTCPPGECREMVALGRMIAVFHVDGQLYGLDGVCPHQGGPLGKGELNGHIVTCPWHGWQFDVRDGQNQITPTICQPRIPLTVQQGRIVARREDLEALPS